MVKMPILPLNRFYSHFLLFFKSESGFSPLFLILFIAAAIGIGTYLVQNRTNIMPFAAESEKILVAPYIVYPADKEGPDYKNAVNQAMQDVRKFYNDKAGVDFAIEEVKVVKSSLNYDKLRCGPNPTEDCLSNKRKTTTYERDHNWLSDECVKATGAQRTLTLKVVFCAGLGGLAAGPENQAVVGDWVLQPLSGQKNPWGIPCGSEFRDESEQYCTRNAALGTIAHELGHGFGLEHPENDPLKNTSVMMNHTDFPNVGFLPGEKLKLQEVPAMAKVSTTDVKQNNQTSTPNSPALNTSSNSKAKEKNISTLSGAFPKGDPGDFIPRSDKQEILNQYLTGKIAGTVECRNSNAQSNDGKSTGDAEKNASSLWVVPDNPTKDNPAQYIIDCSKSAIGSYKNWESVKCGKLQKGDSFQYGCIDTSLKGSDSGNKSPKEDYSGNKTKADCEKAAKKEYCADNGKFVTEKAVWKNNSCQSDITEGRNCTTSDKYKNGQSYSGTKSADGGDGIKAENKPILDKASPEVEKLAEQCGLKDASINTLGIPFYKVGFGNNPSINKEECKGLLATQLKYFEQANVRALEKLKDEAAKNGLIVKKKDDGTYVVEVDPKLDGDDLAKEAALKKKAEVESSLGKVNEAKKAIESCQSKTNSAEKAGCIEGAQKETQAAATAAQASAVKSYMTKFKAILEGQKKSSCVKADLGIAPFMDAKRLKARGRGANTDPKDGGEANDKGRRTFHRLLLCSGKNGDLKWRVLVGGETGEGFTGDETIDEGNDAERLYELHGTTDDASGPPQFGSGFKINECVTLTGQTKETVVKDLEKYIQAAGGLDGKGSVSGNLPECKKPSNPNDTGGNGSSRRSGSASGGGSSTQGSGNSGSGAQSSRSNDNQNTGSTGRTVGNDTYVDSQQYGGNSVSRTQRGDD